jgi:hypothetical protein
VALSGTPSYSRTAAEAEGRLADQGSLALALQVSGTLPIPFGWRTLYLIYGLSVALHYRALFISFLINPLALLNEYLGSHFCTIPVICTVLLALAQTIC